VRVLEPGGAPAAGAAVTVSRAGDDRVAWAAACGEDGTLTVAREMGMAGQEVTLRASAGGRRGELTATLPSEGEVTVRLRPGASLEGSVVGGAGARYRVTVETEHGPGVFRPYEAQDGTGEAFDLADLPPGPVRVTVRTADGRTGQAGTTLAAGETGRVAIPLGPAPAGTGAAR
jgi:hypothetical protein